MKQGNHCFWYIASFVLILAGAGIVQAQSIAVHWSSYNGNGDTSIPAGTPDGIQLPDGSYNQNWTNLQAGYYQQPGTNNTGLQDSTSAATTAAVTCTAANASGTYWYYGANTSTDNLLNGPWGNNGAIP